MKHEVSSQHDINSEILIQSINNANSDPHVLKFITIFCNLRAREMNHHNTICGIERKGMGRECIKVNYNMKCLSEI